MRQKQFRDLLDVLSFLPRGVDSESLNEADLAAPPGSWCRITERRRLVDADRATGSYSSCNLH